MASTLPLSCTACKLPDGRPSLQDVPTASGAGSQSPCSLHTALHSPLELLPLLVHGFERKLGRLLAQLQWRQ